MSERTNHDSADPDIAELARRIAAIRAAAGEGEREHLDLDAVWAQVEEQLGSSDR